MIKASSLTVRLGKLLHFSVNVDPMHVSILITGSSPRNAQAHNCILNKKGFWWLALLSVDVMCIQPLSLVNVRCDPILIINSQQSETGKSSICRAPTGLTGALKWNRGTKCAGPPNLKWNRIKAPLEIKWAGEIAKHVLGLTCFWTHYTL